jgi:two-component system sensor histidine kinase YesM
VREQEWFVRANTVVENLHFSAPHVQNLFEDSSQRYRWVISLSRAVELIDSGDTSRGVLLVDMNYSGIRQIFTQTSGQSAGLIYLMDSTGEIIYHPKQNLIYSGLYRENNINAAGYSDGIHEEEFDGDKRQVIVKTVGYTGWKLVIVIPNSEFAVGFGPMRLFVIEIIGFAILIITLANAFISSRVANPIKRLERSVKVLDEGDLNPNIYIGGPYEIERLGKTISTVVAQMRKLMEDIIHEQENKRKSEFEALQSQIHPHFLYNTLDSIVWMIESERQKEAISMVTSLAQLFRISLAKGDNIIPILTELSHARYYLQIGRAHV